MSHEPGGGYGSKNVVHSRNPKTEPDAHAVDKDAVSQVGQALGFKAPNSLYEGEGYNAPPRRTPWSVGPGQGRSVMSSGSQSTHGPVARGEADTAPDVPATRTGRDILSGFGPDVPGRR